jgi:hypothetical protein
MLAGAVIGGITVLSLKYTQPMINKAVSAVMVHHYMHEPYFRSVRTLQLGGDASSVFSTHLVAGFIGTSAFMLYY